jgi:hypothetical protein
VGIFRDGKGTIRADFALNPTIDEEVIGEANGAFNVDIVAENVALSTCGSATGSGGG